MNTSRIYCSVDSRRDVDNIHFLPLTVLLNCSLLVFLQSGKEDLECDKMKEQRERLKITSTGGGIVKIRFNLQYYFPI